MTTQAKRSTLKNRADRLFSEFIRDRDKVCQAADESCSGPLQAAHIITRSRHSVRWDPANCVALCRGHHMRWTVDPVGWHIWVDNRIGSLAFMDLYRRSLVPWDRDIGAVLDRLDRERGLA